MSAHGRRHSRCRRCDEKKASRLARLPTSFAAYADEAFLIMRGMGLFSNTRRCHLHFDEKRRRRGLSLGLECSRKSAGKPQAARLPSIPMRGSRACRGMLPFTVDEYYAQLPRLQPARQHGQLTLTSPACTQRRLFDAISSLYPDESDIELPSRARFECAAQPSGRQPTLSFPPTFASGYQCSTTSAPRAMPAAPFWLD